MREDMSIKQQEAEKLSKRLKSKEEYLLKNKTEFVQYFLLADKTQVECDIDHWFANPDRTALLCGNHYFFIVIPISSLREWTQEKGCKIFTSTIAEGDTDEEIFNNFMDWFNQPSIDILAVIKNNLDSAILRLDD